MSVISRSPPCQDSTRSLMPLSLAASNTTATPYVAGVVRPFAGCLRQGVSQRISAQGKVFSGLAEEIMVVAAARTTPERCGWSKASSRASQSVQASEVKMSESPV